MTVWAILPSFERPYELVKTIQRLIDQELNENLIVLVLDASKSNDSEIIVKSEFSNNSNVVYNKIESKFLWSKSVNHGFSLISSLLREEDHVLLLNDDINFPIFALQKLLDLSSDSCGIWTALEFLDNGFIVSIPEISLKGIRVTSISKQSESEFQTFDLEICNSRFTLYPGSFIMRGNRFSTLASPHHYADLKFSLKARKNGLQIKGVPVKAYYSTLAPSVDVFVKKGFRYFLNRKSPGYFPATLSFWFQYICLRLNEFFLRKRLVVKIIK